MTLDYIAESLRPLAFPIAELHIDPANTRKNHALDRIASSLRQYGQRKPIVVNRAEGNKVEAGNGTLQAAMRLGWESIAVVFVEDDAATAAGFGIADNRVAEFSEWDTTALLALMPTVDDLFTGFELPELELLLGDTLAPSSDTALTPFAEFKDTELSALSTGDFVLFRFGDYSSQVTRLVYDSFVEEYQRQQSEGDGVLMDDVLRGWLNV